MRLNKILIRKFRNYDSIEMVFEKGINYLYGKNGVGKTNLIEAIYYLGNLESFRTSEDRRLIKDNGFEFDINAEINNINYLLKVNIEKKVLIIDGIVYKKYREYLGHVNVVDFTPEDVYLLKDAPKERRKFIDKEISKIDNEYLNKILIYNKLLKQRNELLKSMDNYKDTLLNVIDDKLSEIQVKIITSRQQFLKEISEIINGFKTTLNERYRFEISYECNFEKITKEEILNKYLQTRDKDKERMVTGIGIHKEDFKFYINGNEASNYGSQGEQRFIVLLIKLALVNLINRRINDYPILVLDDVFSELDSNRKKEIYEIIKNIEQVFITGCNEDDLDKFDQVIKYEVRESKIKKIKEEKNNE